MELIDYDYESVLRHAGMNVVDDIAVGSYEGDLFFLVEHDGLYGVYQASYGSCSGCDIMQSHMPWSDEETESLDSSGQTWLRGLVDSAYGEVTWGTRDELLNYFLEDEDAQLRHTYYLEEFEPRLRPMLNKIP